MLLCVRVSQGSMHWLDSSIHKAFVCVCIHESLICCEDNSKPQSMHAPLSPSIESEVAAAPTTQTKVKSTKLELPDLDCVDNFGAPLRNCNGFQCLSISETSIFVHNDLPLWPARSPKWIPCQFGIEQHVSQIDDLSLRARLENKYDKTQHCK